ncbi:HEPN domain-containing protein [Methanoplanus endosymbiosus]|uniref:ApeA N-terminal domain-containing protein n=1 Tax=Methanoplanus endosymbiosus TaxID=33865 RepID=A0A9E7PMI8_9EURY|nr:HEPN domain-containing protein [Methanoplanus endosymbiosus]UUX92959.1 hypothetical protein L6E24_02200 [Methanoplanus endosymbiosus]
MDETIKIEGNWQIRKSGGYDINRDFPGLLTVKPYDYAVLECSIFRSGADGIGADRVYSPDGSKYCIINRVPLISGRGINGSEITLVNNRMVYKERLHSFPGREDSDSNILFLPEIVIDGYNFKDNDEIKFCRVVLVPDDFVNWVGFGHFSGDGDNGIIIYSSRDFKIKIKVCGGESEYNLVIEYPEEKILTDIISDLQVIQNMITFFMNKPAFFISITGEHEKNPYLSDYAGEKIMSSCTIYFNNNRLTNRKFTDYSRYGSFLISFDELEDFSGDIIGRWREFCENYVSMVRLYFSVVFNPEMYTENVFLGFTECIEIYHRKNDYFKDYTTDPEEYKERTDAVKRLLGEKHIFTKKVRESIVNTLKFGNKPNLENRLNDICDHFGVYLEAHIPDFKEFSSAVSVNRNYIAHRDAKEDFSYAEGTELCGFVAKLEMVIYVIFLHECGFEPEFIKIALSRFMKRKALECFG